MITLQFIQAHRTCPIKIRHRFLLIPSTITLAASSADVPAWASKAAISPSANKNRLTTFFPPSNITGHTFRSFG
jgi:hypothetical protein